MSEPVGSGDGNDRRMSEPLGVAGSDSGGVDQRDPAGRDTGVIREALRDVIDPELSLDVVELGLIRNIEFEGETTVVYMVLTTMTCPFWQLFVDQVNTALEPVESVGPVDVRLEPGGRWTPEMLSEEARWELEAQGLLPMQTLFA